MPVLVDHTGKAIANTPDGDAVEADITGMSLSNPNPFSDRLTEREPTLFLTSVGPGFSSYSRSCPSSVRRQPVILTQAEKDKIDAEHPGSYEHAIEYQTSSDTPKYYYICLFGTVVTENSMTTIPNSLSKFT